MAADLREPFSEPPRASSAGASCVVSSVISFSSALMVMVSAERGRASVGPAVLRTVRW